MGETDLARLRHGLTADSVTSVSMRPPLVLAGVARRARAHDALEGPWRSCDGGEHTLLPGEVVTSGHRDGDARGYHASGFTTIAERTLGFEHLL